MRSSGGCEAQHVIVATVPSVTIAPIARGVAGRCARTRGTSPTTPGRGSPTTTSTRSATRTSPADEARAIDSAIDAYNETIIDSVAAARRDGLDWYLFDLGGMLDRLATRRYINSPWARPPGGRRTTLPAPLAALDPVPNTRFFRPARRRAARTAGCSPWTACTRRPSGTAWSPRRSSRDADRRRGVRRPGRQPRPGPVDVDFDRLLAADTLISRPPAILSPTLSLLGWLDERLDWVKRILPFAPNPL